ncbi:putative EamA domain-containing protein [Helianthus debilis subsp. tardiflorus]
MDMATERSDEGWSWMNDVMPIVVMLMITSMDMGILTIVKAAMNDGMSSIVYVVYHDLLSVFILLPFFIIGFFRNVDRTPLSFHLLFRFFILGLLGICLSQILLYQGTYYTSPTMASAISNLSPGNTFLIAIAFRMEKIDKRSSSSLAKLSGTIIAISGAMLFTFYQGPEIFHSNPSLDSTDKLRLSRPSDWIIGGLILVGSGIVYAIWTVLQSATTREYRDQRTIVFFFSLFGTIQCIVVSPFLEPDPNAWMLQPGIKMIAVVLGAVFFVLRFTTITWCLEKKGPVFVAMFSPLAIVIAVFMGVIFLGDSLRLGSAIGATIVAAGFYTVMWGQAKEKNMLPIAIRADLDILPDSSDKKAPLLSSRNESSC